MIRYGIIGPGSIARKFAKDVKLANNSTVVAVASRNMSKAIDFCKEFDIEHAFGSYEELVKSDLVDAIYVATPHSYHKAHSILAMQNGKHVLCEKPISVNEKELVEMINVAKENNVLLMEAMWTRFLPSTNYVKKIIDEKKFGTLKHMDLSFGFEISEDYPDDGRLINPCLAGGSLLDLGIYPVSVAFYLKNQKIKSMSIESDLDDNNIDLDIMIDVVYEDDTTASFHSSIAQDLDEMASLYFEEAEVHMFRFHHCVELLIDDKKVSTPCLGDGFVHQIEAFTKTIMDGKLENEIMNYEETLRVMRFLDTVRYQEGIIYPFEKKESI